MSETLCTLRTKGGGGGKYTETSLWTNSAPTSSYSGGDVTLSESVEQYKYIKIKCRVSSSNAGTFSTIYSVDDLKTFMANSVSSGCGHIAIYDASNNRHSRGIQYKDSTTINIKVAYQDGTTTQNNANCIPLEILGLNELAHGTRLGPTFELTSTGLSQSSAYGTNVASNDDTLMTDGQKQSTSTGSITVKRNAKGKIFFNYNSRGSVVTAGSVTFGGNTYSPSSLSGSSVDVEFSANDTINYTCPTGTHFASMCITFMETR